MAFQSSAVAKTKCPLRFIKRVIVFRTIFNSKLFFNTNYSIEGSYEIKVNRPWNKKDNKCLYYEKCVSHVFMRI